MNESAGSYLAYLKLLTEARFMVLEAATKLVEGWEAGPLTCDTDKKVQDGAFMAPAARDLYEAVRALRSLHEDRGLRDPCPSREQAGDQEQAHGDPRDHGVQS